MLCSEAQGRRRQGPLGPAHERRLAEAHRRPRAGWRACHLDRRHAGAGRSSSCARRCGASRPSTTGRPTKAGVKQRIGLVVVDYLQLMKGRDGVQTPRAGDQRDLARPQAARQGAEPAGHRPLAAQPRRRDAQREEQAPAALGPARVGRHRAGRRQHLFIYRDEYYNKETADRRRRRAHHRQAAQRPDRHRQGAHADGMYTRFDNLAEGEYEEYEG